MNRYELGVVVRADLEEEAFRAEMERVKGFIDRFGGTIDRVDEWGKRKLAYPIAKQLEGVYTFIIYSAEGNTVREVESRLRLQENVLRFLTIRKDEDDVAAATPEAEPAKEEPAAEVVAEVPVAEEPVAEAVVEEAVAEEAVVEKPAKKSTKKAKVEEVVVEEAAVEEPAVEEAVAEEVVVKEPVEEVAAEPAEESAE